MRWINHDEGAGCYYVTATLAHWMPLLMRRKVRQCIAKELLTALDDCDAQLNAYVMMPDHCHLLLYLSQCNTLHRFLHLWRGRTAHAVIGLLKAAGDHRVLRQLELGAASGSRYHLWEGPAHCLAIFNSHFCEQKLGYIHQNPVRRGLVAEPDDWPWSSYRWYSKGEVGLLPIHDAGL